ncbi:MAG: FHA domain-containing protein [Myxococcales bacterium]|nr:FHA domain-containing protein [Myxococcales bacterium]
MTELRLRYLSQLLDVPANGEFVIGRSRDCQLALEDPLVSRRHAAFRWNGAKLVVEDLGSRNGVKVNDNKIAGPKELTLDDVVTIGSQTFTVVVGEVENNRDVRRVAVTMTSELGEAGTPLALLGGVVEKAFAMGRIDDAERILSNLLTDMLAGFEGGKRDNGALPDATRFALRLASETGKTQWVDWVFNAHGALSKVPPASTVDELYLLARKIRYPVTPAFKTYVAKMKDNAALLGPAEKFALQRIEGLMRVLLA